MPAVLKKIRADHPMAGMVSDDYIKSEMKSRIEKDYPKVKLDGDKLTGDPDQINKMKAGFSKQLGVNAEDYIKAATPDASPTVQKFGNIAPDQNDKASAAEDGSPTGWRTKAGSWKHFRPVDNFDPQTGERRIDDRRNEPSPTHDDEYSQATYEQEAYKRAWGGLLATDDPSNDAKPSPLGYALGGRNLVDYQKPAISDGAAMEREDERSQWDAVKPPDPMPQQSAPQVSQAAPTIPSNRSYQNGGNDSDELDHRPQQAATQKESYGDYMNTDMGDAP